MLCGYLNHCPLDARERPGDAIRIETPKAGSKRGPAAARHTRRQDGKTYPVRAGRPHPICNGYSWSDKSGWSPRGTAMRPDHSSTRSSMCASPWSREACRSSNQLRGTCAGLFQGARAKRPERRNPGQAGEAVPLVSQVQVEQLLPRPGRAGILILQRQQGRVPDQQGRVGDRQAWIQDQAREE